MGNAKRMIITVDDSADGLCSALRLPQTAASLSVMQCL